MTKTDVLIIGSGFGGSVAASRLCDAGSSVILLERGPWRDSAAARTAGIGPLSDLPYGWKFYSTLLRNIQFGRFATVAVNPRGLLEVFVNKGLSVVCSSGVGGGSHVYTALNERPTVTGFWDGHHEAVSSAGMDDHYSRVIREMGGRVLPEGHQFPNAPSNVWSENPAFDCLTKNQKMRHAVSFTDELPVAERTDGGMLGSPINTKHTLDIVYLREALKKGLVVRALTEALGVYRLDKGQGARYRVEAYDHTDGRIRSFFADRVLLAAGTLNTLRLLLKSRDSNSALSGLPALGKRIGTNTDCLALWRVNRLDHDFLTGLPCHGEISLDEPVQGAEQARFLQVGFVGFQNAKLPVHAVRYLRRNLLLVGIAEDRADGTATWRRGRLRIEYNAGASPSYEGIKRSFEAIAQRSATQVTPLPFTLTVHPSGGAALGADEASGVVDHRGEIYGHPGLHVVDGAALPGSTGAPPSMSIAAWSSYVCQRIVESNTC